MALSRVKTWISGEVLTASDLNAEYNNILNNSASLVFPVTENITWQSGTSFTATLDHAITSDRTITFADAAIKVCGHATGLTANRIPYATGATGGVLTDSASLTFDGTTFSAPTITATAAFVTAGSYKGATLAALLDDTATSFTPPAAAGIMFLYSSVSGNSAILAYLTGGSPTIALIGTGGSCQVTTGALTGTTGSDTFITISTHSDGKVYVENRRGSTITLSYSFMAP